MYRPCLAKHSGPHLDWESGAAAEEDGQNVYVEYVFVRKIKVTVLHHYGTLTCNMGSRSVTCYPAEVRIPPLPPAEAGTQFNDPGGMQLARLS